MRNDPVGKTHEVLNRTSKSTGGGGTYVFKHHLAFAESVDGGIPN